MRTVTEQGELHRPGGFHPVQLGNILNGRYEIIFTLRYGSFANIKVISP